MTVATTDNFGFTIVKNESPSANDWSATYWNWKKADALLYQSAIGHKHDGAAATSNPIGTLTSTLYDENGTVTAGTYYFCVTWVDANGLETSRSDVIQVAVGSSPKPNTPVLDTVTDKVNGLTADTYYYKIAYRKGSGETLPSDPISTTVSGTTAKQIRFTFDAIEDLIQEVDSIVVYRKIGTSGNYVQLSVITATTRDYYVDDNTGIPVCDKAPTTVNTFDSYHSIKIDWSSLNYTEAEKVKVYGSTTNVWTGPNLLLSEVDMNIATPVAYYIWTGAFTPGKPPAISECLSNPDKIDLATEVTGNIDWDNLPVDLTWKAPVDSFEDLPDAPDEGEVRVVIDEASLYIWDSNLATPTWTKIIGSGGVASYEYDETFGSHVAGDIYTIENENGTYSLYIDQGDEFFTYVVDELNYGFITGYYGYWETGMDESIPGYGYGATRFNWDTKKFEYWDDTIATPAWVEV